MQVITRTHFFEVFKRISGKHLELIIPFYPSLNNIKEWDLESVKKENNNLVITMIQKDSKKVIVGLEDQENPRYS